MNERIRELAEQAQKVIWPAEGNVTELTDLDVEKFAELIVWECVMLCDKVYEHNDNVKIQVGATFCREDIKEHFGIEP